MKKEIKVYEAPKGIALKQDYKVKVRKVGEKEWFTLPVYRVKVDMHDVREASMAYFDFKGKVEIEISGPYYIYQVDIRPLSREIIPECNTKKVRFILDRPENLSIEINKDRYHNLHLFAGEIKEEIPDENVFIIEGNIEKPQIFRPNDVIAELEKMPKGRTIVLTPGIHYINECIMQIPSDTNIFFMGGAVLIGALICENVKNVHIYGKGIVYMANYERFSSINGIRVSHSENVVIDDLIFINPPHYTVMLGDSRHIGINNIKSFSCEGWSDGIDMMSCQHVEVKGGFLRTSDDCIAIYGSRWDYFGDTTDVKVENLVVWADVAHPLMIGIHGDHAKNGDCIKNIHFNHIDILEHNEYQAGYLGCMTINVGDKNMASDIVFENICIEPFIHGKVLDIQVRYNPDYNPAPGRRIQNVLFKNISYAGDGEVPSKIAGYNEEFVVENICFENYCRNGKQCKNIEEANIEVGKFAQGIHFK